jgi:hypothetical protein
MSRADKRARRQAEHERWLRLHGRACITCGAALDDNDRIAGTDPRQPRACIGCRDPDTDDDAQRQAAQHQAAVKLRDWVQDLAQAERQRPRRR